MKSLILAEKPSVARDIAEAMNIKGKRNGYIENEKYVVTWALGHLVTNAQPEHYDKAYKEWKLEDLPIIPKRMQTVVIGKTSKQFKTVKSLILDKKVKEVIIATDAGREGELVARLILDKVHNKKPIKRLWISSVTKKAIQEGFKKLKDGREFQHLYEAALARSEADWIVGINATRALTTKYDAQLSLGRVQTPTIQLVNARQQEINHFKAKKYYTLSTEIGGLTFQLSTNKQHMTMEDATQIANEIKHVEGNVDSVEKKVKKSHPKPLYNLTDLQQEAYQRYKMGPKETLNTIQNLYERHKVLTYPRTDSNYLTDDMVDTIKERLYALLATDYKSQVKSLLGQSYSSKMRIFKNHKVSDHHAIIPTEVRPDMQSLSNRESKIYMMVAERFLESLMAPHEYEAVRVNVTVGQHIFAFNEKVTRQLGYKALKMNNDNVVKKVAFQKGEKYHLQSLKVNEHETTPPDYFNEGSLLKAMENPQNYIQLKEKKHANTLRQTGGIGTVATRADIIEKLFNLNAIESRDGKIKVTSKGKQILDLAPQELTSPLLTAEWEEKLLLIEKGRYNSRHFIDEMKAFTQSIVNTIKNSEQKYKHDNLTTTECPTCGKFMIKVKTKNGQMLVCQDPTCKTKKNVQRKTNARCPNCKKKMTLFGRGKDAVYRCVCGHTETQEQMDKRFKNKSSGKVSKKEMKKYMNNEDSLENNPFKDALKNLKL
ncbi:DNA topoisomerase III [Staphylococcus sp. EG-SA-6]|uniref:DNA topoisomerase 3 n=7 Tax=Staphylococcus TaxID=1279 RepID=TOP3_STAHJ|nr:MULTISPECIES: DNA topoisomerase III [Staphylococcus]Q4L8B8.1 RecName: Full=DNA topoisomerase 3; AltName: Full=DNA topoisomerase III [Staphylococcus haemolyticus JCSC1435]MBN4934336.1 DNA topoisomerase III [Staphylococcus sp. EG-SA-6]MDU2097512.1 DNA topoisomerase III [Staphylococcus sp.]AKC75565.1 DNA topoisomerase [Staphylococcus haemolyticus]AYX84638.1 DNA topoisomerase III [Staphylococcus haemolyticus]KKI59458.1 DNA topoisomerase III [Staphylococcus haemolyticus]